MPIIRWDPFREMAEFNRVFARMLGGQESFLPVVDVCDKDNEFVVECDVPGVEPDDLRIEVQDNILTIRGRRERTHEAGDGSQYHRHERSYGEFERTVSLPQDIDPDNVSADYNNGVLSVHLAKTAQTQPRQIQITRSQQGQQQIETSAQGGEEHAA